MYLTITSFVVLGASLLAYRSWSSLAHFLTVIIYEIKYNAVGAAGVAADFREAKRNKTDLPRKTGKVAIITGGSRGIGVEVVKMLLQCDMEVIIACRTPAAGEKTIRQIRESGMKTGSTKVYKLDNNSLESVRRFASEIKRDYSKIDVLINNAGVMFTPYSETCEGFEQQWGVNYLSHFLLTSLLLPLLKAAGSPEEPARIVNVSSCAHLTGNINFDDINHKKQFITPAAYGQSKLAQVMFTKSLQEVLNEKKMNIVAFAVHPGVVNTDLFNNTKLKKYAGWLINLFFKNMKQGATPIVYAAVNKAIEDKGGIYISNCGESRVNSAVNDAEIRKRLFDLSLKQVEIKDFFQ